MCVIIYVPKEATISEDELLSAWEVNPDGAGYSIQKDGKVQFKRGFMDFISFQDEITPLIGKYNLMLHFRISTSNAVNAVQTHPYKKGNVTLTQGETERPVICMNGVISKQHEYKGCNDTMSYIVDHAEAFSNLNQDILNIIEAQSGAKWAVMEPNRVLLSSKFVEKEGRFYSNTNHLYYRQYSKYYQYNTGKKKKSFKSLIKSRKLRDEIVAEYGLYEDVLDYIDFNCKYNVCHECYGCLKDCKNIKDIKEFIDINYYYFSSDYENGIKDEMYITSWKD